MSILQGIGKLYVVVYFTVLGLIIKYIVNYILAYITNIGIYGAIIGSMIGFGFPMILNIVYILKTLKIKVDFKAYIFKQLVSSIFMVVVVYAGYNILSYILGFIFKGYFNNEISVLLSIALGMLAYLYAMALNKGITNDEIGTILSKIKRVMPNKK